MIACQPTRLGISSGSTGGSGLYTHDLEGWVSKITSPNNLPRYGQRNKVGKRYQLLVILRQPYKAVIVGLQIFKVQRFLRTTSCLPGKLSNQSYCAAFSFPFCIAKELCPVISCSRNQHAHCWLRIKRMLCASAWVSETWLTPITSSLDYPGLYPCLG